MKSSKRAENLVEDVLDVAPETSVPALVEQSAAEEGGGGGSPAAKHRPDLYVNTTQRKTDLSP